MWRGRDYASYSHLNKEKLPAIQRENVDFVKARLEMVRDILVRAQAAEKGLMWWAVIPSFH